MDVKDSRPVSISEAKDILAKRKEEQAELGYEQNQALEHSERFARQDADKAKKMVEKLMKHKISQELAVKIIDIHPTTIPSIKAIVSKDKIELSEEDAEKILKELE
jgi:DNA-directed RNA polymerase subunit F